MRTVELVLHPVRLRIVQAFLGDRELTTARLAAELSDVPSGGLYRHIGLLVAAGVLRVVSERRVRGTVERTYALRLERSRLTAGELAGLSREDHLQAFVTFVAGLLADYEQYLAAGREPDLERDGVSYSMNAVWLSDEEFAAFLRDVVSIVEPRTTRAPAPSRKRRMIASVFMPLPTGRPENEPADQVECEAEDG